MKCKMVKPELLVYDCSTLGNDIMIEYNTPFPLYLAFTNKSIVDLANWDGLISGSEDFFSCGKVDGEGVTGYIRERDLDQLIVLCDTSEEFEFDLNAFGLEHKDAKKE
jgi:hypothetical protein